MDITMFRSIAEKSCDSQVSDEVFGRACVQYIYIYFNLKVFVDRSRDKSSSVY